MPGRPGESDQQQVTAQQLQDWLQRAIPAHTCAFEEGGAGLLVVGRGPLAIRDDVILVTLDQVAVLAGAFLLNIVAPGIHQALQTEIQVPGQTFRAPGRPGETPQS